VFEDPGRPSGGQTRGRRAPLGGPRATGGRAVGGLQTGGMLADAAVKARLNFNLKFNLRSAAVKPAVKPRAFRRPTTGCTLARRGPRRNITRTRRTAPWSRRAGRGGRPDD